MSAAVPPAPTIDDRQLRGRAAALAKRIKAEPDLFEGKK